MPPKNLHTVQVPADTIRVSALWARLRNSFWAGQGIPYLFLCLALPTVLVLCFLVPPMQSLDENRHFLRAVQFANGHIVADIDPKTGLAGGVMPDAVFDFVRRT